VRLQYESETGLVTLDVEKQDGALAVTLPDGSRRLVRAGRIQGDILLLEFEGHIVRIPFGRSAERVEFSHAGNVYSFSPFTPSSRSHVKSAHTSGELRAPMVGTVTGVLVEEGEKVESYQPILVIEAMKVLATLEAPFAGIVTLKVSKGQQVQHGQVLAEVTPSEGAAVPADTEIRLRDAQGP